MPREACDVRRLAPMDAFFACRAVTEVFFLRLAPVAAFFEGALVVAFFDG